MNMDYTPKGTREAPAIPFGLRNARQFSDGWFLHEYAGNPLGHEYGAPFTALIKHPICIDSSGNVLWDYGRCDDRIMLGEPVFEVKLRELSDAA